MATNVDVAPILSTAFAFWSSKVLLTAVEFGVFTRLSDRRLTGAQLGGSRTAPTWVLVKRTYLQLCW